VNPKKLDQRFELGSSEASNRSSLPASVSLLFLWEIQQEIAMGLVRQIKSPVAN